MALLLKCSKKCSRMKSTKSRPKASRKMPEPINTFKQHGLGSSLLLLRCDDNLLVVRGLRFESVSLSLNKLFDALSSKGYFNFLLCCRFSFFGFSIFNSTDSASDSDSPLPSSMNFTCFFFPFKELLGVIFGVFYDIYLSLRPSNYFIRSSSSSTSVSLLGSLEIFTGLCSGGAPAPLSSWRTRRSNSSPSPCCDDK